MRKFYGLIALLALFGALFAAEGDSIAAGKALVDSNVSCDTLTESQLEEIGDYLMEQMHPGAAHERMDAMMGGEGSESLKRAHIQMAQVLYCGKSDTQLTYGGMMGMMPMMMGYGMMGNYYAAGAPFTYARGGMMGGSYGSGMMGYSGAFGWSIFDILLLILLIGLIVAVYLHISQKLKEGRGKQRV